MKKLLFSILLIGWSFVLGGSVSAQEGELRLQKGTVKIMRADKVEIVNVPGMKVKLNNGDRVQTGTDTKATILLKFREEVIQLNSRSFFQMDNVSKSQSKVALLTGKGQFKVPTKRLKRKRKKSRFKVRTVTAVIGVRGTEFVMGTGNVQTSLLTLSGEVVMAPVSAPDIEVVVPENQASTVVQGAAPTPPVTVPPETRASIVSADSPETFKQVSFPKPVSIEKARKKKKKQAAKKKAAEKKKTRKKEKKKEEKKDQRKEKSRKKETKKKVTKKDDKQRGDKEKKEEKDSVKKDKISGADEEEKREEKKGPERKIPDDTKGRASDEGPSGTEDVKDETGDSEELPQAEKEKQELPETEEPDEELSETEIAEMEDPEIEIDDPFEPDMLDELEDLTNEIDDVMEEIEETEAKIEVEIRRE